jgi:transcription elongation factor S-II
MKIRTILLNKLELDDSIESLKIVTNLEKGIFNYSIQGATQRNIIKKWENSFFVQLYVDRLRSIYMNLQSNELVTKVKNGEIEPQNVAFMTHQQYQPERWQKLIQQKLKRDESKFMTNIQASTDVYQCKRCKSRKCVYSEQQVRSADESMTVFVTCLDCGKQWKC